MNKSISAFVAAAALAVPAVGMWSSAAAAPDRLQLRPKKRVIVVTRKFLGPSVDMHYGPVQVRITVRKTTTIIGRRRRVARRMTNITCSYPRNIYRSQVINDDAVPILRTEALKAQSAAIDSVSGATLTWEAYTESLQQALDLGGM